ncbi:MAG: hypothetical protein GXP44_02835 [bacterium]|nr:hypothetical protein [bacterium]
MWRDWINGILGVWLIVLGFLGFPASVKAILVIATGIIIAFLSFWKGVSARARKEVAASSEESEAKTRYEKTV